MAQVTANLAKEEEARRKIIGQQASPQTTAQQGMTIQLKYYTEHIRNTKKELDDLIKKQEELRNKAKSGSLLSDKDKEFLNTSGREKTRLQQVP